MYCYINKIKNKFVARYNACKNIFIKYFFKFIKIIPIIFLVSIFLLLSIIFFKLCNIQNPSEVQTQEIYIYKISLSNWGTWITLVGLFFTAIWSMHQYTKSKILSQQEKASEIAQDFANNLIERMGLIFDVLMPNQEIQNMIKNLDTSRLKQFTVVEMIEIMKDKNCFEKFDKIINSKRTQKRYNEILSTRYNKREQEKFDSFFPLLIENTLNKLEAICINISSQAAGSQFIYDSLHQIFLSTIEILAIKISDSNTDNINKYYINIISVYNMWNLQKQKDINKFNKTNKKIHKLQTQADNEIKKLLNKPIKTV